MAFTTLNLGLTLTIPTNGTRNWGSTLYSTTWTKISSHDHSGGGNGSQLVIGSIPDNLITRDKLAKNIGIYPYATTLTPTGTTQTVDWTNGSIQKLSLSSATGTVTLTLSNPVAGIEYRIFIVQGATARALVWPGSVFFPQQQAPILSTTSGYVDSVRLYYDGTNYFGDWENDYR